MNRHDVLRREYWRLAALADDAYGRVGGRAGVQDYKDWLTLLLRYHQAMDAMEGRDTAPPDVPSMKGE